MVHRTVVDEPATERVITVDETARDFAFLGELNDVAPRQVAHFNVPEGFVLQIRAIATGAVINLRGETHDVDIPSGAETGIKVEPIDGVPFPIVANERTAARIVLSPFEQLIRNHGQGFIMKPVLEAEHISLEELSGLLRDRVVVRFEGGTSSAEIDEINAELGTTIIATDPTTNYYVLHLPASTTLEDAIAFYHGRDEVRFTLPDSLVFERQVIPDDPDFQNPGPFSFVGALEAWETTTGSRQALLAVIDDGFDMSSPDMVANYAINQGELPPAIFDVDGDGIVGATDIAAFDTDGDGLITFVDLNSPENAELCPGGQLPLTCDLDGDAAVTPLDLVDGDAAVEFGFEDGINQDENEGFLDDLVGWDFLNNDNLPANPGNDGCSESHGVGVAGIVAAVGNNALAVAGMNWVGRLLPIQHGTAPFEIGASTRSTEYLAIRYAVGLGADAVNASWGVTYAKGEDPGCGLAVAEIDDKYGDLLDALEAERESLALSNTLLVAAADDCAQDDDVSGVFDWPGELDDPNIVLVTSVFTMLPVQVASRRAFGSSVVDIAAPGESHTVLGFGSGVNEDCSGTSLAAPMVTGTVGLIIANEPDLRGDAEALRSRLLCNATEIPDLAAQVANGRVLNVRAAVANANACP
jgi:hypothetical protein